MIIDGRAVHFKESFTTQLALIQEYTTQYSPKKVRQLTTNIANYALDVIAANPYIFAEYNGRVTPEKSYRRAIYKQKYVIIYRVTTDQIVFLVIYHASQNPDSVSLSEE
jgi:plasmid stabilization system protein ParE